MLPKCWLPWILVSDVTFCPRYRQRSRMDCMSQVTIQIEASKQFPVSQEALNYHITIEMGKTLALLGRSGCGKTTLLRLLASLEQPTTGTITWPPEIASQKHPIGMVFQHPALVPHLNVRENL